MEYVLAGLSVAAIVLLLVLLTRKQGQQDLQRMEQKLDLHMETLSGSLERSRQETRSELDRMNTQLAQMTKQNLEQQIAMMREINKSLNQIRDVNSEEAERHSRKLDSAIRTMQEGNEKKLEEMRRTVDEKLTSTLTTRLDSSFKTVSEQLENVYKSLGEMKELSTGVTTNVKDLNRVLTNVKARGTWAEVQLENILDQTIPGMYDKNVATNPKSQARVEFAIRIPNNDADNTVSHLPVDSKFPMEDYVRLTQAAEAADPTALEEARKALEASVKREAQAVAKYIHEPDTTPFAIMYLATEGLYAEISASRTGIAEKIQKDYRVMIAGPTTITALLNSLNVGFRTMAIEQKAGEVWKVLGAAKGQYDKFEALLEKARKKVDEAGRVLSDAQNRNSMIQRRLKHVETLDQESEEILGIEENAQEE